MDELSKRDAADLGVDDLTGPQLRWRVFHLEGLLGDAITALDDILIGIARGQVPALAVQHALEITATIKEHYHDRKAP